MQIHKSFIVNLEKIEAFSAQSVAIAGNRLPIGQSFKIELAKRI
jgi:DNA-binding LytR/AlgR family response regulator